VLVGVRRLRRGEARDQGKAAGGKYDAHAG
jgi:hypothetical protein